MKHERSLRPARLLLAAALCAPAAHAGYAGLWFQCQPKWPAEKNYLLVEVKRGERAWNARWGASNSAKGQAEPDAQGNLMLRGCYAIEGKARACDAARPPVFAVLPKSVADGQGASAEAALARGRWIRTDRRGSERLAQQCEALRPRSGS